MKLSSLERRIFKLERSNCGTMFTMPDGRTLKLTIKQQLNAFSDALFGIDSHGSRTVLNTVSEYPIIALLKAVIDYEPIADTATESLN